MAAHDIYAASLVQLQHGYALWTPEPCHYDEVEVGDVGWLWRGAFHRLFNATVAVDHPSNAALGVPDGFVPLTLLATTMYTNEKMFDPGALRTASVSKVEFGTSAEGWVFLLDILYTHLLYLSALQLRRANWGGYRIRLFR